MQGARKGDDALAFGRHEGVARGRVQQRRDALVGLRAQRIDACAGPVGEVGEAHDIDVRQPGNTRRHEIERVDVHRRQSAAREECLHVGADRRAYVAHARSKRARRCEEFAGGARREREFDRFPVAPVRRVARDDRLDEEQRR